MRKSLVLHEAQVEPIMEESDEQVGKLMKAVFKYQFYEIDTDLPKDLRIVYSYFKNQLSIDNKKYNSICERNRVNGAKRVSSKAKKASGLFGTKTNPNEPKKAENENENENDLNSFVRFWDLYNKKVNKPKSQKLWIKLSLKQQEAIFNHVPKYIASKTEKQYIKNPDTYLRNRSWEDEIIKPTNGSSHINNSINGKSRFIEVQPKIPQAI